MTDKFESQQDYSRHPEHITESFRGLLKQGNLETSSLSFVQELNTVEIQDNDNARLSKIGILIECQDRNAGVGYLSSSAKHDRQKELLTTAYVARCFREREIETLPLIVPVDQFYHFAQGNLSLVLKTSIFNEIAKEQNPGQNYALILTGFTDSDIFTQKVLEQVPTQDNAGLDISRKTEFGKELIDFARNQLPLIIEQEKGDLNAVLKRIIGTREGQDNNARLFLVTCLLLQDIQMWQNLWYESKGKGTPLYIVAPLYFHDAMNRLNYGWGQGVVDYRYKASCSLGDHREPPLEEEIVLQSYHEQGLPAEEFKRRIKPLLEE